MFKKLCWLYYAITYRLPVALRWRTPSLPDWGTEGCKNCGASLPDRMQRFALFVTQGSSDYDKFRLYCHRCGHKQRRR